MSEPVSYRLHIGLAAAAIVAAILAGAFMSGSHRALATVQTVPDGWKTYRDTKLGFAISYPKDWKAGPTTSDDASGAIFNGFTIGVPGKLSPVAGASITVEYVEDLPGCSAEQFLPATGDQSIDRRVSEPMHAEAHYAGPSGSDFTDYVVYAQAGTSPCLALVYTFGWLDDAPHTTGELKPAERARLIGLLDRIRATFVPSAPLPPTDTTGWQRYRDAKLGFSISYPRGWKVEPNYVYAGFGPDHEIHGVAFDIPAGTAAGTNLSPNMTNVSVESVGGPGTCDAQRFLADIDVGRMRTISDGGVTYSYAPGSDAGAGNLYEEMVFALPKSSPCLAARYFIHSTNIGNYDPGTIKEFDRAKLVVLFDSIRRSLVLSRR